MMSLSPRLLLTKDILDEELSEMIEKAVIQKPKKKEVASFYRRIGQQPLIAHTDRAIVRESIVAIAKDELKMSSTLYSKDLGGRGGLDGEEANNSGMNIAGRSAMFEFLSDNMGSLQSSTIQAESSKLRSFERLTSEVLKDSESDRPLMEILRTNGWTGSRFRSTSTTPLNSNKLFLAFLNLHISRKVNKEHHFQHNARENLRNVVSRDGSTPRIDAIVRPNNFIKNKRESISNTKTNDMINEEDLYYEQIQSFCPNILLSHLS
jgi:hypothetical protein